MFENKKSVLLGLTGGIAVYKSAYLCSALVSEGFDVCVVMTPNARKLISEQIFLTLSRNPVTTDLFDASEWKPEHIALADRCDLLAVVPCTANFIGKCANGIADDALTTVAAAFDKKVLLAPAMNGRMWRNPAVQENCKKLQSRGVEFIGPAAGKLACGDDDEGRMTEPDQILKKIKSLLK